MILMERIHAERIARVRTALESCGLTQMIVCERVVPDRRSRGTLRAPAGPLPAGSRRTHAFFE